MTAIRWNKYKALMQRDLIEHRAGFILVPAVLGVLLILLSGLSLLTGNFVLFDADGPTDQQSNFGQMLESLALLPTEQKQIVLGLIFSGFMTTVWIAFPFVVFFTLLGSLYEERRDRSFLFWKSMPVSDWEEVIARLVGGTFVPSITYTVISVLACIAMLLVATLVALLQGGPIADLWRLGPVLELLLASIPVGLVWYLWSLPFFAWVMAASAFAPRVPLMYALLPPAVLIAVEGILFKSAHVARVIGQHIYPAGHPVVQEFNAGFAAGYSGKVTNASDAMAVGWDRVMDFVWAIGASITSPQLWIGVVLGIALLAAAVWRRRFTS